MKEHMNYTLLCDFYELTMGNGYFQTEGYADQICYLTCFSAPFPTEAALPSPPVWSRSSTISRPEVHGGGH